MMRDMLDQLETIIQQRKQHPSPGSYTNQLLNEGRGKIAQKLGEEAVETIVAALNQSKREQIEELADLYYHTLVLMAELDITLDDVRQELRRRHHSRD